MEISASDSVLKELSVTASVDFLALKEKYKGVAAANQNAAKSSSSNNNNNREEREQAARDMAKLDKYKICQGCGGSGIQKTIYNHRVVESDCEVCEGDCVMLREQVTAIINNKA